MRVLSLHNFAKYGYIISTNDKIINNLLRLGRFLSNFRRPIAAKLRMGPKKVLDLKWWPGPPLSPCKIWWKSRDARRRERTKCGVFYFLPAGSAAGSSAGIVFTHGPILGFFAPHGRHVAPIKVQFGREERTYGPLLPAKFDLDRFRGGGLRPPNWKKFEFYQYNWP